MKTKKYILSILLLCIVSIVFAKNNSINPTEPFLDYDVINIEEIQTNISVEKVQSVVEYFHWEVATDSKTYDGKAESLALAEKKIQEVLNGKIAVSVVIYRIVEYN